MYNCLKDWAYNPVEIHKYGSTLPNGDSGPETVIDATCYVVTEVQNIVDKNGNDYVSRTQLYFSEEILLVESDRILFEDRLCVVRKISKFYDGSSKSLSIQVVYL